MGDARFKGGQWIKKQYVHTLSNIQRPFVWSEDHICRLFDLIRREYPKGVRELAEGGTWNTIAGQPTDDSEKALLLARMLVDHSRYDHEEARKAYIFWLCPGRIYSHP